MNIPRFDNLTDDENDLFADMFEERVAIMVVDGHVPEAEAIKYAQERILGQILAMRKENH